MGYCFSQLSVDFEGKHYEATSLMPSQAPIVSSEFMWMPMMNERWLSYEMWAKDPNPDQRNYLWFRMHRFSSHPHFEGKPQTEPYTWDFSMEEVPIRIAIFRVVV